MRCGNRQRGNPETGRTFKQASAKGLTRWEISDFPRGDTARPGSLGALLSGIYFWCGSLLLADLAASGKFPQTGGKHESGDP